jgi:hypothetical protein
LQNKTKILFIVGLISTLLISACGNSSKDSASNLKQWTPEEAEKVAALWMPAKTKECEAIIATFQEMQRVLGAVVLAPSPTERTKALTELDTTTKDAVALIELINTSTSDFSIKAYTGKLKTLLPKIAQTSSSSDKEMIDTLTAWKNLIGNPPQTCRNG